MRFIWSIAILCAIRIATSDNDDDGTCFFSIPRTSPLENSERHGGMIVSSAEKCSGKLIGPEKLKIKNPSMEYYGAFHDLDLLLTRGAGHYMKDANDLTGIAEGVHVCEFHYNELVARWKQITNHHILYVKKKDDKILSCSWPIERHRMLINQFGRANYINREEAKNYLIRTGIHLHLGLALCKDHYDIVIGVEEEAREEQCDPTFEMDIDGEDESEDEYDEEELLDSMQADLEKAFATFCKKAGINKVCPRKSFIEYEKDTMTRKVRVTEKILWTMLKMIAPGWEKELFKRLRWNQNIDWQQLLDEKMGDVIIEISRHYLLADDSRTRYIVLSQIAGSLSYSEILPYFEGLSNYKYTKARTIAMSLELPPQLTIVRDRIEIEFVEEFIFYVASPENYVNIPSNVRTATLSNGQKIDIPHVVRVNGNAETIRLYKIYMAERGKSHIVSIVRSGGYLPNADSAAWDPWKIKNRQRATFWHYDPHNIGTGEVKHTVEVEAQDENESATAHSSDTAQSSVGRKGLLFSCWCGASFIRHGHLLNHLNFGKHESHPWKATTIDISLQYYQRCLEDTIQTHSLIPLQDMADAIFDKSIPVLPMGWALRGAKKNSPLPEKTKNFLQAFFLEKTKIGKRADSEEAYLRMIADPSISLDERMTKEQIKRYITRLVATPTKKKVVVRGKRSTFMEVDEDGDVIEWKVEEIDEIGEWEMPQGCEDEEDENGMDTADTYLDTILKNQKDIFDI